MKKALIVLITLALSASAIKAQDRPPLLDPDVRYGVLENGMTYYILHHEEPKERASFYIMQNVGAILEEDTQDGLAHMLEHMAFNGSSNFPEKGVKEFLERQGVEFGRNINAYTGLDETVYNISNVPTEKSEVMDSCVLILHDWSGSLTLSDEEIDAERLVIKEEWRTRNSASSRMRNKLSPTTYYESKYAKRDVIGSMDVVENSPYSAIRSFYQKWYRTDLQAVMIVGDFDADEMEARVKRILSKIPAQKKSVERKEYTIGDNEGIVYDFATDKEGQYVQYQIMMKHATTARNDKNEDYMRRDLAAGLYSSVINERLDNIEQKPDSPFLGSQIGYFGFVRTSDIYYIGGAKSDNNDLLTAMKAELIENERIRRYGVTTTELERAKINMLRAYEEAYKNRSEFSNDKKAMSFKDHYLTNEPKPGITFELAFAKKILPEITKEEVDALIQKWNIEDNISVTVQGPVEVDFEYPTKEQIVALFAEVRSADIEDFIDNVVTAPLMSKTPVAATITATSEVSGMEGSKEYILSNGARVVIYSTDKNENEILFQAYSKGGKSLLADDDLSSASVATGVADNSGIGVHSLEDLKILLTGKRVGIEASINQYSESLSGSSTPEDLETLFQLIFMTFESPRFEKEALETISSQMKLSLKNSASNPRKIFRDSIGVTLSGGNLARRPLQTLGYIDSFDFDKAEVIYRDRISNAGDFVFIFVGAIDTTEVLPLIEKYIGGISDTGRREDWKDDNVRPYSNGYEKIFKQEMEVGKQTVFVRYQGEGKYSRESEIVLEIANSVLQQRYFTTVREEEGGSYGVSVFGGYSQIPYSRYSVGMYFDCNPEKGDRLVGIIHEQMKDLLENGANADEYGKAVEGMIKTREQSLEQNSTYLAGILELYQSGVNTALPSNQEDIMSALTLKKFNKAFAKIMNNSSTVSVIMQPK